VNEQGIETTFTYSQRGGNLTTTATESGVGATQTITTTNEAGTVVAMTKKDLASNLVLESFTVTSTDDLGRATAITYHDGTTEAFKHGDDCCGGGLESQTDRQGNWGSGFIFIQNSPANEATPSDKTNTPKL
jgi:hypothetical protein